MQTFANKIMAFNRTLNFSGKLPSGIRMMNPFKESKDILTIASLFYNKYYNDQQIRYMILGINPGRFGGGLTGIPFTDPKRLVEKCGIEYAGPLAHEPSSVFIYEMIDAFGGAEFFYGKFYINCICPLGFTKSVKTGKEKNYNYYDNKELTRIVTPFIVKSIRQQLDFGINTDTCFCFGNGKNEKFLSWLNQEKNFFREIIALEHPRFIMQYRSKLKHAYLDKYISAFSRVP